MQFKTLDSLLEHIGTLDGEISAFDFDIKPLQEVAVQGRRGPIDEDSANRNDVTITTTTASDSDPLWVTITSFYENGEFPLVLLMNEDEETNDNIWFVDQAEAIKDSCSTGCIHFDDSVVRLNVCEMDGKIKTHLNIKIDDVDYSNIPFTLKSKSNGEKTNFVIQASSLS